MPFLARFAPVALAALLFGCSACSATANDPAPDVKASPELAASLPSSVDWQGGWSYSEQAAISTAISEWPRRRPGVTHIWRVTASGPHLDHCAPANARPCVDGYTLGADVCLYVETIGPNHIDLEHTAAHEYGHALGLDDYAGPEPSIMVGDLSKAAPMVTDFDRASLAATR